MANAINGQSSSQRKGIRSDKIRDRAKSAKDVLKVIRKLISGLGYNHMIVIKFREEIDRLLDFLSKKSRKAEQIFIEFKD